MFQLTMKPDAPTYTAIREPVEMQKWFRTLIRRFGIFRGDPSTRELEMLAEIQGRVRLVVKSRWILLLLLCFYGVYAGGFFLFTGSFASTQAASGEVLIISLVSVVLCNLFYQTWFRELSHFRLINHLQILIDFLFVTILVHFSGGALSWFWTVYLVVTLEACYLLERRRDVLLLGCAGGLMYGALLTAEFYGLLLPVPMPFIDPALQHNFSYEMLMWFWVSIMNATVAIIGSSMMGVIRAREHELKLLVVKDQLTDLYNRAYFFKSLNSEIQRSLRYKHVFSVILLDLDDFKKYNDTYGHLEGDRLLKRVAEIFRNNVRRSERGPVYDVDVPCRYGGEEFAIILPETPLHNVGQTAPPGSINGIAFAERLRRDVESLRVDGRRVTVSIGIAGFPQHGQSPDALVKAADDALYVAKRSGKNRVIAAADREEDGNTD